MTTPTIIERQNIIRQWWLDQATNPLFLKVQQASWREATTVENWMDMQARLACFEHGRLLGSDTNWKLVRQQLDFPVLWVIKNLTLRKKDTTKNALQKGMLSRYYILDQVNGKWVLNASTTMTDSIAADPGELYEWLGVIGGSRPLGS